MLTINRCGLVSDCLDTDFLALELEDAIDAWLDKQLETSRMNAAHQRQPVPLIDSNNRGRDEVQAEIYLAACRVCCHHSARLGLDIVHMRETFSIKQILRDKLRREAYAESLAQANRPVSGGGSALAGFAARTRPTAPAAERPARKRRRLWIICIRTLLQTTKMGLTGIEQKRSGRR